MRLRAAWILLAIPAIIGCGTDDAVPADGEIEFELLTRGAICSHTEPGQVVVRAGDEWTTLWQKAMGHIPTGRGAPNVDFGKRMVLGSFMGKGPVGRDVSIVKVEWLDGRIVVTTATRDPDGVLGTGTSPFVIVHVPWSSADVEWREAERE